MSVPVPFYDRILDELRERDTGYGTAGNPFPATGFYQYATDGSLWVVTIDPTGHLVTTAVTSVQMVGPWLSLGLTNIQHT